MAKTASVLDLMMLGVKPAFSKSSIKRSAQNKTNKTAYNFDDKSMLSLL